MHCLYAKIKDKVGVGKVFDSKSNISDQILESCSRGPSPDEPTKVRKVKFQDDLKRGKSKKSKGKKLSKKSSKTKPKPQKNLIQASDSPLKTFPANQLWVKPKVFPPTLLPIYSNQDPIQTERVSNYVHFQKSFTFGKKFWEEATNLNDDYCLACHFQHVQSNQQIEIHQKRSHIEDLKKPLDFSNLWKIPSQKSWNANPRNQALALLPNADGSMSRKKRLADLKSRNDNIKKTIRSRKPSGNHKKSEQVRPNRRTAPKRREGYLLITPFSEIRDRNNSSESLEKLQKISKNDKKNLILPDPKNRNSKNLNKKKKKKHDGSDGSSSNDSDNNSNDNEEFYFKDLMAYADGEIDVERDEENDDDGDGDNNDDDNDDNAEEKDAEENAEDKEVDEEIDENVEIENAEAGAHDDDDEESVSGDFEVEHFNVRDIGNHQDFDQYQFEVQSNNDENDQDGGDGLNTGDKIVQPFNENEPSYQNNNKSIKEGGGAKDNENNNDDGGGGNDGNASLNDNNDSDEEIDFYQGNNFVGSIDYDDNALVVEIEEDEDLFNKDRVAALDNDFENEQHIDNLNDFNEILNNETDDLMNNDTVDNDILSAEISLIAPDQCVLETIEHLQNHRVSLPEHEITTEKQGNESTDAGDLQDVNQCLMNLSYATINCNELYNSQLNDLDTSLDGNQRGTANSYDNNNTCENGSGDNDDGGGSDPSISGEENDNEEDNEFEFNDENFSGDADSDFGGGDDGGDIG